MATDPISHQGAEPPTTERVARRALALTAFTARAILEQDQDNPNTGEIHSRLLAWVKDTGIEDELELEERVVVQCPVGLLDQEAEIDAIWRLEGLVVLAWALGRFDIPPHDHLVELDPLWRSLCLFDANAARELLASPILRPRSEIGAQCERLRALHWRLETFSLAGTTMDFAGSAKALGFDLDVSAFVLVEGDLALRGERIDRASEDVFSAALGAAQERHQAANWLWQGPALYSEASSAT